MTLCVSSLVRWPRRLASRATPPLLLCVLALGCRSNTGPDWERVVGTMDPARSVPSVVLPASPVAGSPFVVTVYTVGAPDCTRPAGAEVLHRGTVVEITPYDWTPRGGSGCTRALGGLPRPVEVEVAAVGDYTIRVTARSAEGVLGGAVVELPLAVTGLD